MTPELRQAIVDGAYWLREPGPNCQVVVAYTGAVAPEAIQAVGLMAEDRRDVGLLAVTSADRLNAGWTAAQRARERGLVHARSHIERLLAGRAAALRHRHRARRPSGDAGAGSARCTATARAPLGVEHFGQTGSIADLYRHYGIDANAIVAAAAGHRARPPDPAPPRARLMPHRTISRATSRSPSSAAARSGCCWRCSSTATACAR